MHAEKYDLVLLDINMPGITGLEGVPENPPVSSDVRIIMMTVRDTEKDKVEALDTGADDYVAKPFGMPEMLARIRAALRRAIRCTASPIATHLRLGDMEIDFRSAAGETPTSQLG